jgi:hypothetical protein
MHAQPFQQYDVEFEYFPENTQTNIAFSSFTE